MKQSSRTLPGLRPPHQLPNGPGAAQETLEQDSERLPRASAAVVRARDSRNGATAAKYDDCKRSPDAHGQMRYRLRHSRVWVTDFGFHHTGYLDPIPSGSAPLATALDEDLRRYLERNLHFNRQRFEDQAALVQSMRPLAGLRVLDVGCGGGLFLSLLKRRGAQVTGIEVHGGRAEYARTTYDLTVETRPVTDPEIQSRYAGSFDAITLWDVIEHVNFPQETLTKCYNLLKEGGLIFIDTPCRDTFYYKFGELFYKLSRGYFASFLNIMYSDHLFGHKQIFSTEEIKDILRLSGFEPQRVERRHELSFPYEFYLRKLVGSQALARILAPLADLFFRLVRVKNKMIVVAWKI